MKVKENQNQITHDLQFQRLYLKKFRNFKIQNDILLQYLAS